jgi:hypothetical protein
MGEAFHVRVVVTVIESPAIPEADNGNVIGRIQQENPWAAWMAEKC